MRRGPRLEMSDLRQRIAGLSPVKRALLEQRLMKKDAAVGREPVIPRRRATDPSVLSFCQQRLWFLEQLAPHTSTYNIPDAMRIQGALDVEALRKALEVIVGRHEVLRTTFAEVDGRPVPVLAQKWSIEIAVVDLGVLPQPTREDEAQRLLQEEARRPFDLSRDLMLRAHLVRVAEQEHLLLLTVHHIAFDAWSKAVLYRELAALYPGFISGDPRGLPELPLQYADFALWQRQGLHGEAYAREVSYWTQQLDDAARTLRLPTDHPRPAVQTFRGAKHFFALPKSLSEDAKALSRQQGTTLFVTLLAGFKVFLYHYTGQETISVGSPVAGRDRTQLEGLIGFFVNTLVLHTRLSAHLTFRKLLERVREVTLEGYAHSHLPFEKLVEILRPPRDLSRMPLVQVNFRVVNAEPPRLELQGLTITPLRHIDIASSRFDLALELATDQESSDSYWEYSTELFDADTVARMGETFQRLLAGVLAQPDTPLEALELFVARPGRSRSAEDAMREQPRVAGLREIQRRPIPLSPANMVETGYLQPGQTLPLLVQPAAPDVDLADWARNNRDLIRAHLLKHGAILFRGFDLASPSEFEAVATAISSELFGEYGDLPREGITGKIYGSTPYPSDRAILFHNESSHMHRWPLTISFCCVQAPSEGGATPLVDCREVCRRLDPEILERFEEHGLMYVRNFSKGLDVSWQDFFGTDDRAMVEQACAQAGMTCEWTARNALRIRTVCPAVTRHPRTGEKVFFNQLQLHHIFCLEPAVRDSLRSLFKEEDLPRQVYYGDGSPIETNVIQHVREVYEQFAIRFTWQAGDMVTVDNMLTAHGRDPYQGARKIVVAMGDMIDRNDLS